MVLLLFPLKLLAVAAPAQCFQPSTDSRSFFTHIHLYIFSRPWMQKEVEDRSNGEQLLVAVLARAFYSKCLCGCSKLCQKELDSEQNFRRKRGPDRDVNSLLKWCQMGDLVKQRTDRLLWEADTRSKKDFMNAEMRIWGTEQVCLNMQVLDLSVLLVSWGPIRKVRGHCYFLHLPFSHHSSPFSCLFFNFFV